MAVKEDMLKRIMGAPDSPTGRLVALRRTPGEDELETGVWYSNFTRVKSESERRGIPFFAMWTNGDLCGFCRRFTLNILDPRFLAKMRTSGGLWWLGGSMDDDEEDKRGGTGFTWCLGPEKKVVYFPFFAISHKNVSTGGYAFYGSGGDYDGRKQAPDGTVEIIKKIHEIMSDDDPVSPASDSTNQVSAVFAPVVDGKQSKTAAPEARNPVNDARRHILRVRMNPSWDAAHVSRFYGALQENGGHCICCRERTADTVCICRDFMAQTVPGSCRCGAFEKYVD